MKAFCAILVVIVEVTVVAAVCPRNTRAFNDKHICRHGAAAAGDRYVCNSLGMPDGTPQQRLAKEAQMAADAVEKSLRRNRALPNRLYPTGRNTVFMVDDVSNS